MGPDLEALTLQKLPNQSGGEVQGSLAPEGAPDLSSITKGVKLQPQEICLVKVLELMGETTYQWKLMYVGSREPKPVHPQENMLSYFGNIIYCFWKFLVKDYTTTQLFPFCLLSLQLFWRKVPDSCFVLFVLFAM